MEKIELKILPENPEKSYYIGDIIRGKVRVIVHEEWECQGLALVIGIKGLADVHEGLNKFKLTHREDLTQKTLYQGRWSPDVYVYPFEIEVPPGPYTYQGKIVNLIWVLRVEARPFSGEGVRSETELAVVPGTGISDKELQEKGKEVVYKESPKSSMGCLLVSLLLFLVGAGAVVQTFLSGKDYLLGFADVIALLGLALILINLYMMMISKRIGMAEARIGSGLVSPGEVVPVSLVFQVKKPVELRGIQVTLICRERAGNVGIRASKKTYLNVIYEKRNELQLPVKQVPANVPIETRGELSIPPDAPLSFFLADSLGNGIELQWDVEFRIEMNRWPDWFCKEKIMVRPGKPS